MSVTPSRIFGIRPDVSDDLPSVSEKKRKRQHINEGMSRNMRNVSLGRHMMYGSSALGHRLGQMTVVRELDLVHPEAGSFKVATLRKRSQVAEIIIAGDVVVVASVGGIAAAFDERTGKRLCFLNTVQDEVIRSTFYNKIGQALISVSVSKKDNFSSLRCRSISLEYIRRGQPEKGFDLFGKECLDWPGFVELDEVNWKVITFNAQTNVYKVWDLLNYDLLFSISEPGISEMKVSPGILLLVYQRKPGFLPLAILDINTGENLKRWFHPLHKTKKVDFVEVINESLLFKQEDEPLTIMDIVSGAQRRVPNFATPSAFVFLYDYQVFLTFQGSQVAVFTHNAEPVTTFRDQPINLAESSPNNIFISRAQNLLINYQKEASLQNGYIQFSSIRDGSLLGKITIKEKNFLPNAPLMDVTAIAYSEASGRVYSGTKNGLVHCWDVGSCPDDAELVQAEQQQQQ